MNKCDVCGIEKRLFEKQGINFKGHKKLQHNLWDYFFYLVYLHNLDENMLTGFEFFVLLKFKKKSTDWLPIGNTYYMSKFFFYIETVESDILSRSYFDKKLEKMQKEIENKVDGRLERLEENINDLKRILTTKVEYI